MAYLGDTNSQVDVWDNFARVISPGGTPSPQLDYEVSAEDMIGRCSTSATTGHAAHASEDVHARRRRGMARERWREFAGDHVDTMSDAEMMDSHRLHGVPQLPPWGAFNRIVYRFRPNGDDHRSCIMECIFLARTG